MNIKCFIEKNAKMWNIFNNDKNKGNLLVEEPSENYPFITHAMAMQTLILNNGLDLRPLWIKNSNVPIELLQSYVPQADYIELVNLDFLDKFYSKVCIIFQYLKMFLTNKALNFKFEGVKYGDILHDIYLVENKCATLQKPNLKLLKIMKKIVRLHMQYVKTIKKYNIKAVLASHRISYCACMIRAALTNNCKAYTNSGMHRNTLYVSSSPKNLIEYEYTPTKKQIEQIVDLPNELFTEEYNTIKYEHIYGTTNKDAKYAFSNENKFYKDRLEFNNKYHLDSNKKNIFIMLHAFIDHPHAHFKSMLFKDYGDWFLRTLEFAKKNDNVNWIFKQHPSDKYYPVNDIDFNQLFTDVPDNVKFISTEDKVDTRSLEYIADAIVTCLGSAGFEMPAFYGIPSITAGDNPYSDFSFSTRPKTKKEYFKILKELHNVTKLTEPQQKEAQAVYMFIYKYCTVDYKFIPILTHEDIHNQLNCEEFYQKVYDLYKDKRDECLNEIAQYSFEVSRNDFKALRTKDFIKYEDYLYFPFDITKPMPECKYDVLKEGCQILNRLHIPYTLADGTLLGIYRDKQLIPHDTDIDVTVILPVDIPSIIREFTTKGFNIGRMPISYGKVQQIVFYKNEVLFDIIFYKKISNKIINFCEQDYYLMHDAKHYENISTIKFMDFDYNIPNDVEGWLRKTYGEDWNKPKPKPKDWRIGNAYIAAYPYNGDSYQILSQFQKEVENE